MRRVLLLVCSLLFILGPVSKAVAENRALLIGLGQYERKAFNLPGVDTDIAGMKQVALLLGYKTSQIKILQNELATLEGIQNAIQEWLIDGVTREDKVLFYFSGHGTRIKDNNGDEEDGMDEILTTYDFMTKKSNRLIKGFTDDELGQYLDRIPARAVYLFIDSCHSGTIARNMGKYYSRFLHYPEIPEGEIRGGFVPKSGKRNAGKFILMSAAQDKEQAIGGDLGGCFTRGVVDTITKASKEKKSLNMEELRNKTSKYIKLALRRKPELVHHPNLYGNMMLADSDLFQSPPALTASLPKPESPEKQEDLWSRLEGLIGKASYSVRITANKDQLKIGENLVLTCDIASAGYLNVFHLGRGAGEATVLFPNKYHPDNMVKAGKKVIIPAPEDNFALQAQPPSGDSLILVVHTTEEYNAFDEGVGDSASLFRSISTRSMKSLFRKSIETGRFGAGKTITRIVE